MSHPFVISEYTPITFAGPPPAEADVVVIGGGVIGVCTALFLARSGQKVVLLEKGRIAGEQSSRNWGWIRQQGRDPDELPIMMESIGLWKEFATQTNVDFGLRQAGVTYIARDTKRLAGFERWIESARGSGVDTKILTRAEVASQFPGIQGDFAGALTTPSDMRAEPWLAVPALAGIATREGAQLIENCAVRMLDLAAGRVSGVVTETGVIKTSTVVLAGGAWSALFLRNHGVNLPQLSVRQSVLMTQPLPEVAAGAASDGHVAFRRRADGCYTLAKPGAAELYIGPDAFRALPKYLPQLRADPWGQGYLPLAPKGYPDAWGTKRRWGPQDKSPFEEMRVLNPTPNRRHTDYMMRRFSALYPSLPPVQMKASWAGMIDTMPDVVPVIGPCPDVPGLVIGTGMSGHGFGIGPGIGRAIAALVTGGCIGHDLHRFRADRFTDGSPVQLGPIV